MGVGGFEAWLQRGQIRGERGQRRQVRTGRTTRDNDGRRVGTVGRGMLTHPGDDPLRVNKWCGVGREPVIGADAHPALAGQTVDECAGLTVLAAAPVAAAVEVDQARAGDRARSREVHVEQVLPTRRAVGQVRAPQDVVSAHGQRREQQSRPRAAPLEPGRRLRRQLGAPSRAQPLRESQRAARAGLRRAPQRHREPGHGQYCQAQTWPPTGVFRSPCAAASAVRPALAGDDERQLVELERQPPVQLSKLPAAGNGSERCRRRQGRNSNRDHITDRHELLRERTRSP